MPDRGRRRVQRALVLGLWDCVKLWHRLELVRLAFVVARSLRRWTRDPLREREKLLWMKFMYEVVSGYGEGETEHLFPAGTYPRWFKDGGSR